MALRHSILVGVSLLSLLFAPSRVGCGEEPATAIGPAKGYEDVAADLARVIEREIGIKEVPAFTIALVDGDRVVWARAFGREDPASERPATLHSVHRFGSLSKLFTGIAVARLVEKGKLDLDRPVSTWLPEFHPENPFGGDITLRLLLAHRSGLVREPPVGSYFDPDAPPMADVVESLSSTRLVYPPGTHTKYSNAGVTVAGRVVEVVTGRPFADFIAETIFTPLGMRDATFAPTFAKGPGTARGLMWSYDGRKFPAPEFRLGTPAAGSFCGSILDLAEFLRYLFRAREGDAPKLLEKETLEAMWTPRFPEGDPPRGYGIGFHVSRFQGERRIGHGGAVYGFATSIAALPDAKLGVAAVATLDCANTLVGRITDHALESLLAHRAEKSIPPFTSTEPLAPGDARTLAGIFADGNGGAIELEARGDRLFLQRGTLLAEVRRLGGEFQIDDRHAWGPSFRATSGAEIELDGKTYRRVPSRSPAPPSDELRSLIGEYGPDDGRDPPGDHDVLYILERHGELHALIEWFYEYPLEKKSEDRWLFPDYGLYEGEAIVFERGSDGRVTRAIAAGVPFLRRHVGTEKGEVFRIEPLEPVGVLREHALAAKPPKETGDFRTPNLVELVRLDPTLRFDIRYATTRNFLSTVFYREARAFLQRPAAEALQRAHERVKEHGFGLLIHDGYRPWFVTKMFWDATPESLRNFVADPAKGSRHNRGSAVDLALCDLETGEPTDVGAGYDEFSPRSFAFYPGGSSLDRWRRRVLREAMESEGFAVYPDEWWHFDYHDWQKYAIGNVTFADLGKD